MKKIIFILFLLNINGLMARNVKSFKISVKDSVLVSVCEEELFPVQEFKSYETSIVSNYLFEKLSIQSKRIVESLKVISSKIKNAQKRNNINNYQMITKLRLEFTHELDEFIFQDEHVLFAMNICQSSECLHSVREGIKAWFDKTEIFVDSIFFEINNEYIYQERSSFQNMKEKYIEGIDHWILDMKKNLDDKIKMKEFNKKILVEFKKCLKSESQVSIQKQDESRARCILDYSYFLTKDRCRSEALIINDKVIEKNIIMECDSLY